MEISTIPPDAEEWEARKVQREEEKIRRLQMRQQISQPNYEDELLCFGREYQDAWGKNTEDITLEYQNNASQPTHSMNVSSIPTDPYERERRLKMRREERKKRKSTRPPPDYADVLLYLGEKYKRKYEKLASKGYKDMRNRYPRLRHVLESLNTSKDITDNRDPVSVVPLDHNVKLSLFVTLINIENLRFGTVPSVAGNLEFSMVTSGSPPAHCLLEPADPPPDYTHPENPARIRVRTVREINALPRELFTHLLDAGAATAGEAQQLSGGAAKLTGELQQLSGGVVTSGYKDRVMLSV